MAWKPRIKLEFARLPTLFFDQSTPLRLHTFLAPPPRFSAPSFPSSLRPSLSSEHSHNSFLTRKNFEHPAMFTYTPSTPEFEPVSPRFEDRTHPASMAPCGIHDPALLEFIRTDVSRELVCKSRS